MIMNNFYEHSGFLNVDKLQQEQEREQRIIDEAHWYLDNKSSVRDVAANFMVGKSTVWRDFTKSLKHIDIELYDRVCWLLSYNKKHSVEKMNAARNNRR